MQEKIAKILVVDDLTENLHAMRVTLEPLEVEIDTASSGNEALSLMTQNEYAVVLLDVQMPRMDGFETASLMQGNETTRGVPLIFVTAINKEEQHIFQGYDAGAVDYLFKPVNPDILLSKVKVFINLYNTRIRCDRMQLELQKSRNLESLGTLAGGIAHDFNNILTAIVGNVDLAKMFLKETSQPDVIDFLNNANKSAMRAKDLTFQLLTFAKGGDPVMEFSSMVEVIKESANFIIHGSKVDCRFEFADDLWPVEFDTGQISQVIRNMVLNAREAMPDGGSIEISYHNCSTKPDIGPGRFMEIIINDHGVGISADLLLKIFDPYVSTKETGRGLGLSICHSIIKKHGGRIEVQSKPGTGTKFSILLPAIITNSPTNQNIPNPQEIVKKTVYKIMILDDEKMIRTLTQKFLERHAYEVLLAENGEEAVKIYKDALGAESPIDIGIMDLSIPGGMGGHEAANEILKLNPNAKLIVSSGYDQDPVMANFQEYGFCDSLTKPYELQTLLASISKFI